MNRIILDYKDFKKIISENALYKGISLMAVSYIIADIILSKIIEKRKAENNETNRKNI